MPRHEWTPTTAEQRRAIAAVRRIAARLAKSEQATADLRNELWAAVQAARTLGASAKYMAQEVKRGRATLYRHVPAKKPADEAGSGGE